MSQPTNSPKPLGCSSCASSGTGLPLLLGMALFGLSACGEVEQQTDTPAPQTAPLVAESQAPEVMQAPGESEPEPAGESQPAPRAADFDVQLKGPVRVIPSHAPALEGYALKMSGRLQADGDNSQRERVAVHFESACERLFTALMAGDEQVTQELVAEGFMGFEGLDGNYESVWNDGVFEVDDLLPNSGKRLSSAQVSAHWRAEAWTVSTVGASVVGIEPDETGDWRVELELRLVGERATRPSMLDLKCRLSVPAGESDRPAPRLSSFSVHGGRRIQRLSPAFAEISAAVFGPMTHWDREIALGCEDYMRKADHRLVSFGTGILGMALGDVNGDGLEDIYISTIGGFPNRLLLHQPDGTVKDAAQSAGLDVLDTTRGALLVDLDGDGDLDLALARIAAILLYWNDGSGKFSRPQVLDGPGTAPIYSLSAADPDADGDLDLFAARYPTKAGAIGVPTPYHDAYNGAPNIYWRNDGKRGFKLAGRESGLTSGAPRFSFVSLWEDFNGDGQLDLYVVNDFGPNNLYINHDGHFADEAQELGLLDAAAGMGITVADVEMDGDLDLFVTNMYSAIGLRATAEPEYRAGDTLVRGLHHRLAEGNSLLIQGQPGSYSETGVAAGVNHGGWAWGAVFYDWNLDGLPDLYVPNGFISAKRADDVESFFWRWVVRVTPPPPAHLTNYSRNWGVLSLLNQAIGYSYNGHEPNHVYLNIGAGQFADVSPLSGVDYSDDGRVASRLDWDGDGCEDLLLVNRTGPRLRMVRNLQSKLGQHRLVIELDAGHGAAGAIGARVRVMRSDGKPVTRTVYAGEGLLGQSSTRLFFGLGESDGPVQVSVRWPDGKEQQWEGVAIDRGWKLSREGQNESWEFSTSPFEGRVASPVQANERGVVRCVLADKMPLKSLSLQQVGGGRRSMDELGPSTKLLTLWDPSTRSGEAFLRQIAAIQGPIARAKSLIVPVALEGSDDGQALLKELGLGQNALSANETDFLVLETLLIEVLNSYDEISLPLSLLLDEESNLCAVYFGDVLSEELLEDLTLLRDRPAKQEPTLALSGGYWLRQPKRRYRRIARALMMLGARKLAKDLKKL